MARGMPVTVVLLALLAGAWVSQAAAHPQDPSVAEAATLKHRKHGKYDKEPKYYEKHDGHGYHGKEHYSGDKPSYSGEEYSSGYSSPYSGDSYSGYSGESDPTTPGGTPPPLRHIEFKVELSEKLKAYIEGTGSIPDPLRSAVLNANKQTPAVRSDWANSGGFQQSMNVYCPADDSSYGYKHDTDATRTPIAIYVNAYQVAPAPHTHIECYGQTAEVVGYLRGLMGNFNAAATSCDKDLKPEWDLETLGKIASTPAMLKLPDSTLAKAASAQYGEYYDEHAHAVCGLAFIFNGTGSYGTEPYYVYVHDEPGAALDPNGYAYTGPLHYLAGFNGRTMDGKTSVEIPLASGADAGHLDDATWKLLESKCKHHRHGLPVVKYGLIDVSLRRSNWEDAKAIHDAAAAVIPRP